MASAKITFYAEGDVQEILEYHAANKWRRKGDRGRYLNEAVRRRENPPYTVRIPRNLKEGAVTHLIQGARNDLIVTGGTLSRLIKINGNQLKRKVREEHLPLTVLLLKQDIPEGDPLYEMLARQLGAREFVGQHLERTGKSMEFFQTLRAIGVEAGTPVRLFQYAEVPMYGLIIADHLTGSARMRANIYTIFRGERLHPFMDVDPTSDDGRMAYRVFSEYYEGLMSRSVEIL